MLLLKNLLVFCTYQSHQRQQVEKKTHEQWCKACNSFHMLAMHALRRHGMGGSRQNLVWTHTHTFKVRDRKVNYHEVESSLAELAVPYGWGGNDNSRAFQVGCF